MFPAPFDYVRATTLSEAVELLVRHGEDAKILAGGHSLIPAMKLRLARPTVVIDIGRVAELNYVRDSGGQISIGATTTHREIEASPLLSERCPLLPAVAACIGDIQVRNKGTIGGSLAHADPAADWPAAVLALDAEIVLASASGLRTVKASAFFVGILQTAIAPGEILSEIRVPSTGRGVAYVKTEQKASGFAICGVAAVLDARGGARVGVTGVAATAYRASAVEQALAGKTINAAAITAAASRAADGADPLSDIHATAEFRAHLARVNTARALTQALGR